MRHLYIKTLIAFSIFFAAGFAQAQEVQMIKRSSHKINKLAQKRAQKQNRKNRNKHQQLIAYQDSVSNSIADQLMGKKSATGTNSDNLQVRLIKRN